MRERTRERERQTRWLEWLHSLKDDCNTPTRTTSNPAETETRRVNIETLTLNSQSATNSKTMQTRSPQWRRDALRNTCKVTAQINTPNAVTPDIQMPPICPLGPIWSERASPVCFGGTKSQNNGAVEKTIHDYCTPLGIAYDHTWICSVAPQNSAL